LFFVLGGFADRIGRPTILRKRGHLRKGDTEKDIINIANSRIALYKEGMPRTARASVGGMWYHVLNRGNRGEAVFHKSGDYDAFVEAIIDARARLPMDVLGYCLSRTMFTS
jgi:hypothetical protein